MSGDRGFRTAALAALLFFVSGGLGLAYQLVWIRKATLLVGTSQLALSTVLTSFFLGLAVGSAVVGRRLYSRRWSPLLVYGLFEAGIGLFALAFPLLFGGVESLYGILYPRAAGSQTVLFLVRLLLLFVLFLPPTFLMGGTLPLLLDGLVRRDRTIGESTSLLYGLNILGAVTGVLITSYLAIPRLGLHGTSQLCGYGNLAVGLVAVLAFSRLRPIHDLAERGGEGDFASSRFFVSLAFLSGFASIGYQVLWARYFSLFRIGDVYLTAILLAVFLAALAAGSWGVSALLRFTAIRPLQLVALTQAAAPLLVLIGLHVWDLADLRYDPTAYAGGGEIETSWRFWSESTDAAFFAPCAQVALAIGLPVLLLGAGLPALVAAATRHSGELRRVSGSLLFWNTVGASAGGFAAGYGLIPGLGLGRAFLVLTLLTLLFAAAAQWRVWRSEERGEAAAGARYAAMILGGVGLVAGLFYLDGGLTRRTVQSYGLSGQVKLGSVEEIVEGPLTTAYLLRIDKALHLVGGNVSLAVVSEGKPSGQALQGHLPVLLHPGESPPERGLGIALGSGQTVGAMLAYPFRQLDVVDISREIVDLSLRTFADVNHGLASDPRVTIYLDDGRHFIERAPDDYYDVVSLEPPPPDAEGVNRLYSLEFCRGVERILREDGVLAQWLPLYLVTPDETRAILKTQAAVFPNTYVFMTAAMDFTIVSFKGEPHFRAEQIAARLPTLEQERFMKGFRWNIRSRHPVASLEGLLSAFVVGPQQIAELRAPSLVYDDTETLSYGFEDRQLLRRHYPRDIKTLYALSFELLPISPFSELQRYFDEPLPVDELAAERAHALRFPPLWLEDAQEQRYANATSRRERAEAAVDLARLAGQARHQRRAIDWLLKGAAEAAPSVATGAIATARGTARLRIAYFGDTLAAGLDELPAGARSAPLGRALREELDAYEARAAERHGGYLRPSEPKVRLSRSPESAAEAGGASVARGLAAIAP